MQYKKNLDNQMLLRVIHAFDTNPGFGGTRPAIFASMGPNWNKMQRVKNIEKLINPLFSPSENKVLNSLLL